MEYNTKIVTGKVRLNWPALFAPKGIKDKPDSPKTYQAVLLIDKEDKKTITAIKNAIDDAIDKAIANPKGPWKGVEPEDITSPLQDGDKKNRKGDHPEYAGCWFLNAKAKPDRPPGVIDIHGNTLTSEKEIYAGCFVLASVDFYAYSFGSEDGIACGLNNIMKVKDGPAFSARNASATDDFADFIKDDGLRKKSRQLDQDDEDEAPRRRRPRQDDDDSEDEAPRRRSRRNDDFEDEGPKRRRSRSSDDDEDETPRRKPRRDPFGDDDEDETPKKRRSKPYDLDDDDLPY